MQTIAYILQIETKLGGESFFMLAELIASGFGQKQDFNCAEKILYGANQVYQLGLTREALKLSAGFGGGMGIGDTCGALTAGVMVLSHLFVNERGHESKKIKALTQEFYATYRREMQEIHCAQLKATYFTPEKKCADIIHVAAKILDKVIAKHMPEKMPASEKSIHRS